MSGSPRSALDSWCGEGLAGCAGLGWVCIPVVWRAWLGVLPCGVGGLAGCASLWCGGLGWVCIPVVWGAWLGVHPCGVGGLAGCASLWCGGLGWVCIPVVWGAWLGVHPCGVGGLAGCAPPWLLRRTAVNGARKALSVLPSWYHGLIAITSSKPKSII